MSRFRRALRLYERAIEAFTQASASWDEIARCKLRKAEILYYRDKFDESVAICEALLSDAQRKADERFKGFMAEVHHLHGRVLVELGRHEDALDSFAPALDYFRNHKERHWEADIQNFRSEALDALWQTAEAREAANCAFVAYRGFGDHIGCSESAWSMADIEVKQHQYEEAERWYRESYRYAELSDDMSTKRDALMYLTEFLVDRGRQSEASAVLSSAEQLASDRKQNDLLRQIRKLQSRLNRA